MINAGDIMKNKKDISDEVSLCHCHQLSITESHWISDDEWICPCGTGEGCFSYLAEVKRCSYCGTSRPKTHKEIMDSIKELGLLCQLKKELAYLEYQKIGLINLDPLIKEVETRLEKLYDKNKND